MSNAPADEPAPDPETDTEAPQEGPGEDAQPDAGVSVVESDDVRAVETSKVRVVEADRLEVVESQAEREARKKEEEAPPRPKSNFGMLFLLFAVLFVMIDPNLREMTGRATGVVLNPIIGFDQQYPVLTVILAGAIMITLSTIVRHFFIDWIKMARTQNTMRSFQKEFNAARREKDTKRINELQKTQTKLMGLQAELSGSQMKPMGFTMLVVIPMFAWLWEFVSALDYTKFSAPWNLEIDMFTTNGILFGTSVLPHWILLYSILSIPFGQLLQKALKVYGWRKRVDHILSDHPDVHEPSD